MSRRRSTSLCVMTSPHNGLQSILDPCTPSTGFLCCFTPPSNLMPNSICLAPHLVLLLFPGVAVAPDQLPRHHLPYQALLSSAHRRLNFLGACLDKRIGIRQVVVVTFPFSPTKASEEQVTVDLTYLLLASLARAPRGAPVQYSPDYRGFHHPHLQQKAHAWAVI